MELMDKLIFSYSDNSFEHAYFLDLWTGEIILEMEESMTGEEPKIDWDDDESAERYIEIPKTDSNEGYRLMVDFARQIDNSKSRDFLFDALDRRRPFRRFKDAVIQLGIEDEWYKFEDAFFRQEIKDWIELKGLSYKELNEKFKAGRGEKSN
ncbi:uncharacterized protein UPF0158 [Scopulibacillus darangshiensis]|uniref:Uncharacterized protein UPF0158 n=1 Tax=Scopulibacillus darangshiensis TaxID=442528 RepID=A0A4R2NP17_9BACL|nr:UPF0158 family protein [Scopulibacillus darangshiensis]TCP23467.1 uncharacterized protein UPF0158 [Scopulibacillus darangshiensis]